MSIVNGATVVVGLLIVAVAGIGIGLVKGLPFVGEGIYAFLKPFAGFIIGAGIFLAIYGTTGNIYTSVTLGLMLTGLLLLGFLDVYKASVSTITGTHPIVVP